ncbi:hypothetical protein Jann_0581 [Jannaschia sp. CCS1]|nr:hypothetical protein Jann_0581 [Jannaschia sp. CCS1]
MGAHRKPSSRLYFGSNGKGRAHGAPRQTAARIGGVAGAGKGHLGPRLTHAKTFTMFLACWICDLKIIVDVERLDASWLTD